MVRPTKEDSVFILKDIWSMTAVKSRLEFISMESRLPKDFRVVLGTEICFKNILRAVLDKGGSF